MRRKDRSRLYMVIGVLTLIAAIIVAIFLLKNFQPPAQTNTNPLLKPVPADSAIVQQVTGVSPSTWQAVGTGGLSNAFKTTSGQPPLKGANGHPQLLYIGGEFCPHCAAERWAIINALSRFGTFSNLSQLQAYEYNISTFGFHGSSYNSQYVDFVPVEVNGNALDNSGQYVSLDKMTPEQQQLFNKYNPAGNFPFINIGNQYIATQATYQFTTLMDSSTLNSSDPKSLSWQTIANALSDPKSPISKGILGSANYMTAAICNLTNQQPGNVCNVPVIQQIEQTLGKTSQTTNSNLQAIAPADLVAAQRRVLG